MKLRFRGKYALLLGGTSEIALKLAELLINNNITPLLSYRNEKGKEIIEKFLQKYKQLYDVVHIDYNNSVTSNNLSVFLKKIEYVVDFVQGDYETFIAAAQKDDLYTYFNASISFRSYLLKEVGRAMIEKKFGRFIYISSTAALRPNAGQGMYAAAKAASEALYRNLGIELGSKGITAVTLRPGYIDCGRGKLYKEKTGSEIFKKIPIGRLITAQEVAENILFFLSEQASAYNATEIVFDGGLVATK